MYVRMYLIYATWYICTYLAVIDDAYPCFVLDHFGRIRCMRRLYASSVAWRMNEGHRCVHTYLQYVCMHASYVHIHVLYMMHPCHIDGPGAMFQHASIDVLLCVRHFLQVRMDLIWAAAI